MAFIVLVAMLSLLFFEPTPLDVGVQVVLFAVFYRYCHAVLAATARGRLRPPSLNLDLVNEQVEQPFKVLGLFALFGFLYLKFGGGMPPIVRDVVPILFLFCLPAMVMVIATSNRFFLAINPLAIFSLIYRTGFSYVVLCAFLFLLWFGSDYAFLPLLSERLTLPLLFAYSVTSMYLIVVMFHMMGYLLYQYHEELGFDADEAWDDDASQDEPQVGREVGVLLKEGEGEVAIQRLEHTLREQPGDLDLMGRLHELLREFGESERLADHGRRYVSMLLGAGQVHRAAQVYRACCQCGAEFIVDHPDATYALVRALRGLGAGRLAVGLVNGFSRRYENHPDIPRLYFLAAQILFEDLRHERKALSVLEGLLHRYATHTLGIEIRDYLEMARGLIRS